MTNLPGFLLRNRELMRGKGVITATRMISFSGLRPFLIALGSLLVAAGAHAESLAFAALKENETVVVNYESTGCFHHYERKYVIRGSSRLGMDVFEPRIRDKNSLGDNSSPDQFLVRAELTQDELDRKSTRLNSS